MSSAIDIPIVTAMQEARNNINVLSSKVLFFVGMNAGTASELALAVKFKVYYDFSIWAPEEQAE
jgi:hypothetical protein